MSFRQRTCRSLGGGGMTTTPNSPFISTTPRSAPVHRTRYSRLRLPASAYSRSLRRQRGNGTTGSRVPSRSPHHAHAALTPDTTWPRTSPLARFIPGLTHGPGSDVVVPLFRRVIGRFAFAHLRGAHLTEVPPPFPATLKTLALDQRPLQWFGTPLSLSWSRRAREPKLLPPSLGQHRLGYCLSVHGTLRQQWFTHVRLLVAHPARYPHAFSAVASHPGS
jgi:hypothetical protein